MISFITLWITGGDSRPVNPFVRHFLNFTYTLGAKTIGLHWG